MMNGPLERKILAAAALTVLALVLFQLWRRGDPQYARPRAYASKVQDLLDQHDWDEAAAVAWAKIMTDPLENRAHFYYGQAMLDRGFPSITLEHLVLAATTVAAGRHLQESAPPSTEEVSRLLEELEQKQPEYMSTATARIRVLRLAAASSDWPQWRTLRQSLLTTPSTADGIERLDLDLAAFFDHATGAPRTQPEPPAATDAMRHVLLKAAGMKSFPFRELGVETLLPVGAIAVLASGVFSGNEHLILLGEEVHSFQAEPGWLFVSIKPETAKILDETRLSLTALTDESTALTSWVAKQSDDMLIVGCASGEILRRLSPEGRTALHKVFALNRLPEPESLQAFTFLANRYGGQIISVKAAAIGADMPAMILIGRE